MTRRRLLIEALLAAGGLGAAAAWALGVGGPASRPAPGDPPPHPSGAVAVPPLGEAVEPSPSPRPPLRGDVAVPPSPSPSREVPTPGKVALPPSPMPAGGLQAPPSSPR